MVTWWCLPRGVGYKFWTAVRTEARAFAKGQPPTFSWWVEARRMKDVAGMNVNDLICYLLYWPRVAPNETPISEISGHVAVS